MKRILKNRNGLRGRTEFIYALGLQDMFTKIEPEYTKLSNEEKGIKNVTDICEFVKTHNRPPSQKEHKLLYTLHNIRLANLHPEKTRRLFLPVYQEIANKYGLPTLFTTYIDDYANEQKKLQAIEVCEWIITNNSTPKYKKLDTPQDKLISNKFKHIQDQYSNGTLDIDIVNIITSYNLNKFFNKPKRNTIVDNTIKLKDWMIANNNRFPTSVSTDKIERRNGFILNKIRQLHKKNQLQPECINILKDADLMECLNLSIKYNKEQINKYNEYTRNKMIELCKWMISNNRTPKASRQCDIDEKTAYRFLNRINNFMLNKKVRLHKFPDDIMEIPTQYNCLHFFKYM